MATRDRPLLEDLGALLQRGSIRDLRPQRAGWEPCSAFVVASLKAHHAATIPFCDRYLPRFTAKWRQFDAWRDALLQHERDRPTRYGKGPSPCSIPDCDAPVRGRGLCRRHYHRATGY